jgi:hypothetical protein
MADHDDFRGIRSDSEIELMDRSTRISFQGGTKPIAEAEAGISYPARSRQRREESSPSDNVLSEQVPLLVENLDAERDNSVSDEVAFTPDPGSQYRATTSIAALCSGEASLHSHLNDESIPQISSTSKPHIRNLEVKPDTERPPTQNPTFTSTYSNKTSSLSLSRQTPDGEQGKRHKNEAAEAGEAAQNQNSITRNSCLIGLICTFIVSIPLVASGSYLLHKAFVDKVNLFGSLQVSGATVGGSQLLNHFIPLGLNIGITLLTESLGLIHATTLRWTLYSEGRLQFNTNLRLFTSSHGITPNTWVFNTLNAIFLIASYASTSLVFISEPSEAMVEQDSANLNLEQGEGYLPTFTGRLHISGLCMITLGVGLLGQAVLATWAYCSTAVPTWSSSPLDTALASHQNGVEKDNSNTMLSVGDTPSLTASHPLILQESALHSHHQIRRVLWVLWAVFVFGSLWTIAVAASIWIRSKQASCAFCGVYRGTGWWPIPDIGSPSPFATFTIINSPDPVDPVCLLFVFIFQAFVTLGLHFAELLVNVSRDEDFWRATYKSGGYKIGYNSILAAATSWKSLVLLAFKPVIHWLYGLGVSTLWGVGLVMRPASLMYMTLSFLLLSLFGTGVARARPKGPQPVTYGHVQTTINLVDCWQDFDSGKSGRLYWGHKFEDTRTGVCRAGTSDQVLPRINMEKKYL